MLFRFVVLGFVGFVFSDVGFGGGDCFGRTFDWFCGGW